MVTLLDTVHFESPVLHDASLMWGRYDSPNDL